MTERIVANSFAGGELSPELHGRYDLQAYHNGAASLLNFIPRRTGGIRKRPGTDYLTEVSKGGSDYETLDGKYKVFDFYYSSSAFGLFVLRLTDQEYPQLQARIVSVTDGKVEQTTWRDVGNGLGITTSYGLDEIACRQIGDTLFLTRAGHQTIRVRIYFADMAMTFTPIYNAKIVKKPYSLTVASNGQFGTNATSATTANTATGTTQTDDTEVIKDYVDKTLSYALYGVRDGIVSKPKIKNITVTSPWKNGAAINISGPVQWSLYDYYLLGKKTGANYGKIAEIWPQEEQNDEQIGDAGTGPDGNGVLRSPPASDIADIDATFQQDELFLFEGNPADRSTKLPSIVTTPRCYAIETTEISDWYNWCIPHFVAPNKTAANYEAYIVFNQQAVHLRDLHAVEVKLPNCTAKITPFIYRVGRYSEPWGELTVTSDKYGQFTVSMPNFPAGSDSNQWVLGFRFKTQDIRAKECVFLGAVFVRNTASSVFMNLGDGATSNDRTAYESLDDSFGITETVGSETVAIMEVKNRLSGRYYISSDDYFTATTMWQYRWKASMAGTTASERSAILLNATTNMSNTGGMVYHPNAVYASYITFSLPTAKTISSIDLYMGADVATKDGQMVWPNPSVESIAVLSGEVLGVYQEIQRFTLYPRRVATVNIPIEYPSGFGTPTNFKLEFDQYVPIRGAEVYCLENRFAITDDNIIPGEITGRQELIRVGDSGMDAGAMDVFQQRSVLAKSPKEPFSMWFSATGDLYNFYANRPQTDADAFGITIPATKASSIRHIMAGKDLLVFTEDGVYVCAAAGGDGFSYRTVSLNRICSNVIADDVPPIEIDGRVVFLGDDHRTVYELAYNMAENPVVPIDRTVLAYHLSEGHTITAMAYQRFPDNVLWCLLDDGKLLSMTYMPDQAVAAWAHHEIADVDGKYRLVNILSPGSKTGGTTTEATSDIILVFDIYDGDELGDYIKIERMRAHACTDSPLIAECRCVDHAGATTSADETAVSASMTTLRPEMMEAPRQGFPKRIVDTCIRIRRTGTVSVKPDASDIAAQEVESAVVDGTSVALATGDKYIMPGGLSEDHGRMVVASDDQFPCEIVSIIYTLDVPS